MSGTGVAFNATVKIGRNDPCPCGSGRKYKHCCQAKESAAELAAPKALPSPAPRAKALKLIASAQRLWAAGKRDEAIAAFQDAARLDLANPNTHHDLGAAYFHNGQLSEAAGSFRRALSLRPGFDRALHPLAYALEQLGQEREASVAYRRLSKTAGDVLERRLFSAKALHLDGAADEAEKELRRAIAVAPDYAAARVMLGELLLERGQFEDARRHLVQAVEVLPDAIQPLSATGRMTEVDRPLLERIRDQAERADLGPIQRGTIHFGLGKAFDDLGDYAEAMRHYEAGSRLKSSTVRFNRADMAARYDNLIAGFSAEELEQMQRRLPQRAHPDDNLPVLIVGMPRSGTTLVEQILSSHPSVAAGGELSFWTDRVKEWRAGSIEATGPIGFSRSADEPMPPPRQSVDLDERSLKIAGNNRWLPSGFVPAAVDALPGAADEYLALLRGIGPRALRVTDKAPSNFERLGTIRLALPGARIIHCRRHPVDTCLSIFFTSFKGRQTWDRADLVFQYRQYERLMAHWRSVLPPDRFTEVQYEALIADREAETRRLIAFCGLEWDDACLAPERNERGVRTASLWQARQPVYTTSVERWRRYEPWLGEFRDLLPPPSAT